MASPWSSPTTVNTSDSGAGGDDQRDPKVIELANGNVLVAWVDESRASFNTSGSTIVGRIFDSDGNAISGEIDLVPMFTDGNQDDVALAATDDGGFVVAFSDTRPGGDEFVRVARFDSSGTSAWTFSGNEAHQTIEGTLGTDTTHDPAVTVLADGRIVVAVENVDTSGDTTIRYQSIAADGTASTSGTAASSATYDYLDPEILVQDNGDISLVFSVVSRSDPNDTGAQRYEGSYNAGTGAVAFSLGYQLDSGSNDGAHPDVANLANGDYVLVWEESPHAVDWESTATWVFDASETPQTNYTDRLSGNYTSHLETDPSVIGLANGGYAVVWTDQDDGTIELRLYDSNYEADGGVFRIPSSVIDGTPSDPDVIQLSDGRLLITYDEVDGSGNTDAKFVIYDIDAPPQVDGTTGSDTLEAGGTSSTLNGFGNNDTLLGGPGDDFLDGGSGADSMQGNSGNDTYVVEDAGDTVSEGLGEGTADTVRSYIAYTLPSNVENLMLLGSANSGTGNVLDNLITGSDNGDTLNGDNGNDTIEGGAGNDSMDGGSGTDTALFSGSTPVVVKLGATGGQNTGWGTDTLANIENIKSGRGSDKLFGNSTANALLAGAGNDTLSGGAGNDSLDGGRGKDTALFSGAAKVTVNLAKTGGQNTGHGTDTLTGIENVTSGRGDDVLSGDNKANVLASNGGNDLLKGANGNDLLGGGVGNDTLNGGVGRDTMKGGNGDDLFLVDNARDKVLGGKGHDLVKSSAKFTLGGDVEDLILTGRADLKGIGNKHDNDITGNRGSNELHGKAGDDTIAGGGGNDRLFGESGNDRLLGGGGKKDVAVYSGKLGTFDFKELSGGKIKVIDHSGANGTDILKDVELIKIGGHLYDLHDLLA